MLMYSRKRSRASAAGGSGSSDFARRRAIAIAIRERKKFPYRSYGVAHLKRGGQFVPFLGASYRAANAQQRALRKELGYYGAGDYMADYRAAGGSLLRGLGGHAGSYFGRESLGRDIGGAVSRFVGMGDYQAPMSNQIIAGSSKKPLVVNPSLGDLTGDIYFSHREFIGNVTASSTAAGSSMFQITSYPINVGLESTFPFLSQIAQNFTMYKLEGCIFEFVPTTSDYGSSSSNQLGKVIMATQYDCDASAFSNSVAMENYDYATAMKPSVGQLHGVETKHDQRLTNELYIRSGTISKDKVLTDYGIFQIATEGINFAAAGTAVVGELWVSYRVRLSRANLSGQQLPQQSYGTALITASGTGLQAGGQTLAVKSGNLYIGGTSVASNTTSYASGATQVYNSGSGGLCWVTISGASNTIVYRFPDNMIPGRYMFNYNMQLTGSPLYSWTANPLVGNSANISSVYQGSAGANDAKAMGIVVIVDVLSNAYSAAIAGSSQTGTYVAIQVNSATTANGTNQVGLFQIAQVNTSYTF